MDTPTGGVQSISRAALLLRIVARSGESGARTADIVRESGLTRPTVHRMLSALRAEGLLDHDALTQHWVPGPEMFLMGTVAAARYDVSAQARDIVRSLAAQTEESAFLSVRRGDETVCLLREDGAFPIRSHVLYEGVRFPLGVASAGLAILALMSDDQIDDYLSRSGPALRPWGESHLPGALRERIALTREAGYAVNPGLIVEGSWGMGAAVFDRAGQPQWALSLTGIESRFTAERRPWLGRVLLEHAHALSKRLQTRRAG